MYLFPIIHRTWCGMKNMMLAFHCWTFYLFLFSLTGLVLKLVVYDTTSCVCVSQAATSKSEKRSQCSTLNQPHLLYSLWYHCGLAWHGLKFKSLTSFSPFVKTTIWYRETSRWRWICQVTQWLIWRKSSQMRVESQDMFFITSNSELLKCMDSVAFDPNWHWFWTVYKSYFQRRTWQWQHIGKLWNLRRVNSVLLTVHVFWRGSRLRTFIHPWCWALGPTNHQRNQCLLVFTLCHCKQCSEDQSKFRC